MKTAISIPDPVFEAADELAAHLGISRSELYHRALAEYLREYASQNVTEALDRIYSKEPSALHPGWAHLQQASLPEDDW